MGTMLGISFILFLIAFAAVAIVAPLACKLALRLDFVDRPGGRKKHEQAVPPVGGLVVFPVFMALAMFFVPDQSHYGAYFLALLLLVITGGLDDKINVPAWIKFGVQFVAAILIVVPGHARLIVMGDLFGFGEFGLNFMSIPFSIIATVLLINAVNLMDGLDGLSGGIGFVVMFLLAIAAMASGAFAPLSAIVLMMGVLGGFLLFNLRRPGREKAVIFMGDSGSMALGLTLAWFTIHLARGEPPVIQPIAVAWILALPIYDTCGQFARRVREGRHPFDADHNHFHHHFIHAGFPDGQATAIILSLVFVTGLIGVGGLWIGLPEAALTYPWIALLFAHIYMSMHPDRYQKLVASFKKGKADG